MSSIAQDLDAVRGTLPKGVRLVAVSKFHPIDKLMEAYNAGQRAFGESRVQEIVQKIPQMPSDVHWHFIGHLQTNKVRQLLATRAIDLIESVDSEHLLAAIDREAERLGIVARVLLQVHVAAEETKFGFSPLDLLDYFSNRRFEQLKATHICGIMAMASNTDETERVKADFAAAAALKKQIIDMCPDLRGFDHLSMGMSDDYPLAIAAGADIVRVGSKIFGLREY